MASSFSDLGIELMATGENAGTWGDKTNTNLQIVEKAIGGYVEQAVTSGGTTALSITDGDATESTSVARHAVIKLTGTITGNSIVTVPDSIEKVYIVTNGTSGAYTVQFKTASGTGITFGVSEKTTRLVYSDGTNLVDAGFGGSLDVEGRELILDADGDTSLTADTDDQIDIKVGGTDRARITTGAIAPSSSDGISLGTSALEFSDLFLADGAVVNFGDDQEIKLTHVADTGLTLKHTATSDDKPVSLTLQTGETDIAANDVIGKIDFQAPDESTGTDAILVAAGIEAVSEGDFSSSSNATKLSFKTGASEAASEKMSLSSGGNLTISGDLTVSGDDITMGTNTAGNLLVADGTNFNSIAVSSLSEISTIASGDTFLAVDASGGGLKKVARSVVVSGLATSSAISDIVEDTSPQLGGNLDTNSQNILIDDAHFIGDENGNEQIIFQTTSSAVNQFDVTNAATGNPPSIKATGGDTNIDFNISAKGTGHVTVLGDTNAGAIQFNCESNSHGQILKSQPHSASVTNVMLLPAGADSTLVSLVSTDTLTNKTLTSPKVNEDVAVTSTATELNILDGATVVVGEINALDLGSTAVGTAIASKAVILDSNKDYTGIRNFTISGEIDAATGDFSGAVDVAGSITSSAAATITVSDNSDTLTLVSTDADANSGPNLRMYRNSSSPADSDLIGNIQFEGRNDNSQDVVYGEISARANDVSDGTEDGLIFIKAMTAGTLTEYMRFDTGSGGIVINDDSADLDFRIETNAEANAFKIDGGSETAVFGVPVTFNDAANVAQEAITSSSNAVAWDATDKPNAFHLTTENTTFSAPSNAVEGAFICLEINYNGSHTIAFNTVFEFAGSTAPTTTDTDGKTDILVFRYNGAVWQEVGRTLNLSES